MCPKQSPKFPADRLPDDAADQKLLGIYPQRQEGLYLQRVRVPGGRLTRAQWTAIADAAEAAGAREALHLTTRQCIEVHGLVPDAIPALQKVLVAAGLSTVGAAGDTLRTITVDPLSGLVDGAWELMPLARAAAEAVADVPGIWELPRKFKISFSADESARMRPWITDVGFVAASDGTLSAVVAGSLGSKPSTGVPFAENLSADEAIALAVAAVRLHAAEGDRENRRTARLRHVRERMGDAAFLGRLRELFEEEKRVVRSAPHVGAPASSLSWHRRLSVPMGDLPLHVLRALLGSLGGDGELRIGIEHDLHVFATAPVELPEEVSAWGVGRVVACPGTALCSKAAASTHEAAAVLAEVAAEHPDLLFAISGCPNSCAHAAVADIGLIGRMRRVGDERVAEYTIYSGGSTGAGPDLSVASGEPVRVDSLAETVRAILAD